MEDTIIMSIETSCDETAVAIIKNGREILANVVSTQIETHKKYGGVVPEIASRKHLELINLVIAAALDDAKLEFDDLSHIAVTYGPGLVGALLMGVSAAKALSFASKKPLIAVNHIEGHVYANFLSHSKIDLPVVCLIVSGGHTNLVLIEDHGKYKFLGRTRDDAAGEAFDKIARSLGLVYPGGPEIEKLARLGDKKAIDFPRAWLEKDSYDFSFSGLKSAVLNYLNSKQMKGEAIKKEDVAASFQEAILEVLVEKTIRAAKENKLDTVLLAGGVSANGALREKMARACEKENLKLFYPELKFCTDNGAMIGAAAHHQALRGDFADMSLNADPNLKFGLEED